MSEQKTDSRLTNIAEKEIVPVKGVVGVLAQIVIFLLAGGALAGSILCFYNYEEKAASGGILALGIVMIVAFILLLVLSGRSKPNVS